MVYFHIGMFLLFQVIANLFFKWGSMAPQHYWWGFALGNAVGITSILFMLGMYRAMPAAAVIAVGTGGTFLLNQVVMYLVYREPLSPAAAAGLVLIFAGILMTALLNHPAPKTNAAAAEPAAAPEEVHHVR